MLKYLEYSGKGVRAKRRGSKDISMCVVPVCGYTFSRGVLGSLQIDSAANHPGPRLQSLSRTRMRTTSTFFSAEASSVQPFCRQLQAAAQLRFLLC